MRLNRLALLRYGHLSEAVLDFTPGAALHVVHGANEAGKSTALSAIADGLFGFGHRTAYDFQHGGPQLRVGFTLGARDGAEASFVRRKGKSGTLRGADDQPVSEDALHHYLGGATRDLFERSFGLDGERLREGGHELLRSGGEAGESLMASTGLMNLRLALAQLDEQANSLVGDRRRKRRLSEAAETWRTARAASEDAALRPRAWEEAAQAVSAAAAELTRVQQRAAELAAEESRLQRVRRVTPLLAALQAARVRMGQWHNVPALPADTQARWMEATRQRRDAARDEAREAAEVTRLDAMLAALGQDEAMLGVQDEIDALSAAREKISQASQDLPIVQSELARSCELCRAACLDLGEITPEQAFEAVPHSAARGGVQALVGRYHSLQAVSASAASALASARQDLRAAEAALATMPEPQSPALLRRTIEDVRGQGRLDIELADAQSAAGQARTALATALSALPLWQGDAAGLAACKVPLAGEISACAACLEAAEAETAAAEDAVRRVSEQLAGTQEEIARLSAGQVMPTPEIIAGSRTLRDQAWRELRAALDTGQAHDATLPDRFEANRDEADRLADRRADEAQRVAAYLAATARSAALRVRMDTAAAAQAAAARAQAGARTAWAALWQSAGLRAGPPAAMAEWCRARADVLALAKAEAEAARHLGDVQARHGQACAEIAALCPGGPQGETLAAVLRRAETACAESEDAAGRHRDLRSRLEREQKRLPGYRDADDQAKAAVAVWGAEWDQAVQKLGLPGSSPVQVAEAALGAWARIAEQAPAWRSNARRIADMQASISAFAADVQAMQTALADTLPGEPQATAARLARRLASARRAAAEAAALQIQRTEHGHAAGLAARRLTEAEAELAVLRLAAGVADDEALEQALEKSRLRQDALQRLASLKRDLIAHGDGHGEDALLREAQDLPVDDIMARLEAVAEERSALGQRREALGAEQARAEARLRAMEEGGDAAHHAQDAEHALADAQDAAEQYARLHVARVLLRAGIERFRAEQQGPLLRAAGAHFALLTGGRYVRLGLDEDSAGRTVLVGVRGNGMECPVEALSEGTRDQLYLSLRVAAIEAHAARAEPLPFIADDLLVHFDDTRACAAVALLAELGRTTQVILFTHHDHIAALAEGRPDVAVHRLAALA